MRDVVSTEWLQGHLSDPDLVIVDVRWYANMPGGGSRAYVRERIPGAVFLDLDTELSDRSDLTRGRHPLPDPNQFVQTLARVGIGEGTKVVAYDDSAGSNAARLWWMMRWIGADNAAVLDGGITRWIAEGRSTESGKMTKHLPHPHLLTPNVNDSLAADRTEIQARRDLLLIDARSPERFRGESEPIDSRAGHIPGAVNVPYGRNLTAEDAPIFRDPKHLRDHYMLAGVQPESEVVCYCGSGVTACHNILALTLAGFDHARLYAGSWSEWICHSDA